MRAWVLLVLVACAGTAGCALDGLVVSSPTVEEDSPFPRPHTCDENDRSPALEVGQLPSGTETVTVALTDLTGQAPEVGWIVWNIPAGPGSAHVPEGSVPDEARMGTNSEGALGYAGPCPPSGGGEHAYRFTAYALDRSLEIEEGATWEQVQASMEERVLAQGHLTASYSR